MTFREKLEQKLSADEFIFDREDLDNGKFAELVEKGMKPVCPRCAAPVQFARTPQEAKSKGVPPGFECSKNVSHLQIAVNFAREIMEQEEA